MVYGKIFFFIILTLIFVFVIRQKLCLNTICSNTEPLKQEEKHLEEALTRCKYPAWALNKAKMKTKTAAKNNQKSNKNTGNNILGNDYFMCGGHPIFMKTQKF